MTILTIVGDINCTQKNSGFLKSGSLILLKPYPCCLHPQTKNQHHIFGMFLAVRPLVALVQLDNLVLRDWCNIFPVFVEVLLVLVSVSHQTSMVLAAPSVLALCKKHILFFLLDFPQPQLLSLRLY